MLCEIKNFKLCEKNFQLCKKNFELCERKNLVVCDIPCA